MIQAKQRTIKWNRVEHVAHAQHDNERFCICPPWIINFNLWVPLKILAYLFCSFAIVCFQVF